MERSSRFEKTMSRYGSRFDMIDVNNRSQEESMKVKKYIRELFPKIPEADLQEIYERAWEQVSFTSPLLLSWQNIVIFFGLHSCGLQVCPKGSKFQSQIWLCLLLVSVL